MADEGTSPLASTNVTVLGAFAVTGAGLRSMESHLRAFAAGTDEDKETIAVRALAYCERRREPIEFDDVAGLLTHRNAKRDAIWAVCLAVNEASCAARCWFDSAAVDGQTLLLSAVHPSAESVSRLAAAFVDESHNLRLWYWPLRWAIDKARCIFAQIGDAKRGAVAYILIFVGVLFVVGPLVLALSHAATFDPDEAMSRIAAYEELRSQGDDFGLAEAQVAELDRAMNTAKDRLSTSPWWQLLNLVLFAIGGLSLGIATRVFFPRLMFVIGEGEDRMRHLRRVHWFVLGSVIICGICVPLVRSLIV